MTFFSLGFAIICNVQGHYRIKPKKPEGHFNESLELICSFKKNDAIAKTYSWFRGETVITDKTSGYLITTKPDKSTLTIKNLRKDFSFKNEEKTNVLI